MPDTLPPQALSADTDRKLSTFRWTHGLLNRVVRASDTVAIILAALLAPLIWDQPLSWDQRLVAMLAGIWAFLSVLGRIRAYRVENYVTFWAQLGQLVAGSLAAWAVISLVLHACLRDVSLTQSWVLGWHALQFGLLLVNRALQSVLTRIVEWKQLLRRKTVVIGTGAVGEAAVNRILSGKSSAHELVGVYRGLADSPSVQTVAGVPVSGGMEDLARYAQDNTIDLIVLAEGWGKAPDIFRMIDAVEWIAADVVVPFEEAGVRPSFARIAPVAGMSTLQVMYRPFKGSQGITKAVEDYVIAGTALLILSPFLLLVALAIRLDSPGPALFRQPRTGLGQKAFSIYKFRTMTVDPNDDGSVGTNSRHNPRITRVGGILRKLSIDEIPQLLNVLKGDMSVVGPRPYVANMLVGQERFSDMVRRYAVRHRIKPGLTGYAQANGMRSNALRDPENARKSIEMDLYYITHWSLWLDIRIMVRTLFVGLAGRNVF
ncbi:exopolysaccharide biosynthesis polyprenyl glycosylphosphotransferase [Acetobacteraceae bacterium AT-5844]|nr:exopolysaccharide biosynthesis polyprenyl glycosylphosphotransferase [Acetobacteraceae bacterium AT-5844]